MTCCFKLSLALAAATLAFGAQAADFPGAGKTITIVVPFAAGGPTDKVARDLAEALRKPLGGATIVIDNSAGAGSTIGTAKVFRANPDGYTLLVTHIGIATTPALYRKLPYKVDEFEFAGLINEVPMVVVGKPSLAANNWGELKTWLVENKGKANLANAGLGAVHGLAGVLGGYYPEAHHGALCGILLPGVMRANLEALGEEEGSEDFRERYLAVSQALTGDPTSTVEQGIAWVEETLRLLSLPSLSAMGARKEDLVEIAEKSTKSSSMKKNAVALPPAALLKILENAY